MKTFLVEFKTKDSDISDFVSIKAIDEESAIKKFNEHKPTSWNFVGIKQIWFMED